MPEKKKPAKPRKPRMPKKQARDLTTDEAMERMFSKETLREVEKVAREQEKRPIRGEDS
jgi:hypothetical protein